MTVKFALAAGIPTAVDIRELCEHEGPCISIYLGPHQGGSGTRPAKVRLHGAMAEVEKVLEQRGVALTDRESLLAPFYPVLEEPELAGGHSHGLALFRAPRMFRMFSTPWPTPDTTRVESRFAIAPLVAGLSAPHDFYLLALSRKHTRLFRKGSEQFAAVPLPGGLPESLVDFTAFDATERNLNTNEGTGFGTGTEHEKLAGHFRDFCNAIDRAMQPLLLTDPLPLIIAGTESEAAAYRRVNSYKRLVAPSLFFSPDAGFTPNEMAAQASTALTGWLDETTRLALAHYEQAAGTPLASNELNAILQAAAAGRVRDLLFSSDNPQVGNVDRIIGKVRLAGEFAGHDDDLLNAAVVETILHAGNAIAVPAGAIAGGVTCAATFRY